jgi:nucleoside-diphosphate-sugar epimerase
LQPRLPIPSLRELLQADLDSMCAALAAEFEQLAGKRLLITGGAGFLGYYLVQAALHFNDTRKAPPIEVTVFDNFMRGVPSWLTELSRRADLKLLRYDLRDPLPAEIADFAYLIHAAGIASPIYYRKQPIETMDANINGLRSLLEYCLARRRSDRPVEGFLFYSSSEIYGDPPADQIPTREEYRGNVSCTGPRACYDESKRYGETLCATFYRQYELPIKIARPFNNYGPGLKISDRRVLPDFCRDVLAGRDIVMLSDGAPTRTFCYSADAIIGYYKVLVRGRGGEAYNIGVESPEISMSQLAEAVVAEARELFGYAGRVVREVSHEVDYLVDNPNRRCPDLTKARRELDYRPSVSFSAGLRRALIWYYHNQSAEDA